MYSKVSKYSPEARKRLAYRSRQGKSCGYYMRIVFLFSSLIQSLIIVSLVLFLVYGNRQDSASVERIQDLEVRFSRLSLETVSLRQQRKNLTHLLNVTAMEKARNDWDLAQLRFAANISYILLDDTERKLKQCNLEKPRTNCPSVPELFRNPFQPQPPFGGCNCGQEMETLKARMELLQSNFTQTAMLMQMEMDQISRDRDNLNLEAIQLRRDKAVHEKAIQFYQFKCKEEFVNSLSGISNVSKAFLSKIDSLFHSLSPFHITCPKQKEYLEQIRNNCTDLSEEVVGKFQTYLDSLGNRVSISLGNISVLTAENMRMTRDYNQCSQNRSALIREHKQNVAKIQLRNDEEKEKLLREKLRLKGEMDVLENSIKLKDSQLNHMNQQLKHLNLSCIPRTGSLFNRFGNQPGSSFGPQSGSSNPSLGSGVNQFNRNTFGSSSSSSGSSNPFGSSFSSNTNTGLSSSNTGFNKQPLTGSSSSSYGSSSSNNQGSSNQGSSSSYSSPFGSSSSGSSANKPTSTGFGSSSSTFGSFGSSNNPSSSSSSQNKFGSGTSTSNLGSSSSSKYGSSSSNSGSSLGFGSSSSNSGSSSSSSISKTTSNSRGSSNSLFGSSSSSSSSGQSSSSSMGSGSSSQNKLSSTSNNKGSSSSSSSGSSSSSSSGSSSTNSKPSFSSWGSLFGGGSSSSSSNSGSSSDQSKTGSNQGRGTSSSGSSFGSYSGRTNTFSFTGPISVNQHLRDLQRIINPQGPEQKQELSRILG